MALDIQALIDLGLKQADAVTASAQVAVQIRPAGAQDANGDVTPASVITTTAIVQLLPMRIRNADGQEVMSEAMAMFPRPTVLNLGDIITVVSSKQALGPILKIATLARPGGGGYFAQVWCGVSVRRSV
jgi:hypothetical protein